MLRQPWAHWACPVAHSSTSGWERSSQGGSGLLAWEGQPLGRGLSIEGSPWGSRLRPTVLGGVPLGVRPAVPEGVPLGFRAQALCAERGHPGFYSYFLFPGFTTRAAHLSIAVLLNRTRCRVMLPLRARTQVCPGAPPACTPAHSIREGGPSLNSPPMTVPPHSHQAWYRA